MSPGPEMASLQVISDKPKRSRKKTMAPKCVSVLLPLHA